MLNFPKYLSIQTTSTCNASCVFCPSKDTKDLFPAKIMDMALYKKIIDECPGHEGVERVILYMNNEPLTDPYLIERVNYAKENLARANVHILTNGFLLTREMQDKLISSKLDWIGISFHGIRRETIEKSMGLPYDITLERLNGFIDKVKAKKNVKDYLMITFLRHKYLSLEEKEEAVNFWKSKGIERISYFDGPVSRAGNVKDLDKVYKQEKITGCNSIWADEMVHIVEDGKVVLCCMDWKREVVLGDLNDESIHSIWNGRRKDTWQMISGKKDMPDGFLCRRCEEAAAAADTSLGSSGPDVLLINLPPWGVDTPALGTACLNSYLRSKGISSGVLDLNIKLYNMAAQEHKYFWSMNYSCWWRRQDKFSEIYGILEPYLDSFIKEIACSKAKILGFSLPTNCSDLLLQAIVKKVKAADPSKIIVLGGVSASIGAQRQELLKKTKEYIDYCIIGEGEKALSELVSAVLNGKGSFFDSIIPGTAERLDELPFPDFEGFDLKEYKVPNSIVMEFSRGCIGSCPFCDFKSVSPFYRAKTAALIAAQIRFYKDKYNTNHISVCDAAVNGSMEVLEEVCDLLIKDGLKVDISALAIPRKEMTADLLKKMKRAGFYRLEYGVESGSDKILKAMRKIFTAQEAEKVVRDTYKAGIGTYLYFIVGYPSETQEDVDKTKEFLKENAGYITKIKSINPLYIMAGSEMFNNPQKYNITFGAQDSDRNWRVKDENTCSIREQRITEVKAAAKDFKVPFTEEAESIEFTADFLSKKPKGQSRQNKALLVICPMWDVTLPPMGVAYLASYLESKGIGTDIMDINIESYAKLDSKRRKLWKMENYNLWAWEDLFEETRKEFEEDIEYHVNEILRKGYRVVGFSIYGANILFSIEVAARLRKRNPGLFIIFGGPSCFFLHDDPQMPVRCMVSFKTQKSLVEPGVVDAFVVGEGEKTLHRLVSSYFQGRPLPLKGVILYLNGRYTSFLSDSRIEDLGRIPYPAWDKLPLGRYCLKDTLPLLLSRGCVNRCAFCNDWKIWEGKYRHRPALNIFEEIKAVTEKFDIKTFQCNDLLFNGNLKMLEELADLIIGSDINIRWNAQGVIRKDMDLPLLKKLGKSGLNFITYGMESLSEKVLEKMGKRYSFDDIRKVLKDTRRAHIGASVNFIVGFPNETREEFEVTKSRLTQVRKYINEISSLNPCYITADTDLERSYRDFSITLPKESWDYYWHSQAAANNYEIRKKRAIELSGLAKAMGLNVRFTGIYDKEKKNTEAACMSVAKHDYNDIDFLFINLAPWAQENPHIGIGYLSAYLRSKNIRFKVLDLNKSFYLNHPDFKMLWHVENKNFWSNPDSFDLILKEFERDIEEAVESVVSSGCGILGFSVVDPKERITVEFIKRVKSRSPDKKIILGGPATSTLEQRQFFLDNAPGMIDAFVVGEGEAPLYDLLKKFLNSETATGVEGCCLEENGRWVYNERKRTLSLDEIPHPTYEEFDLSSYGRSLLVEWSRGCVAKCAFCKNYRLFLDYRPKPASRVLNELRYHRQKRGISEFTVVDSILNGNLGNLEDICDKIIREDLGIRWNGQIAPRKDMGLSFFKKMKEAGCFKLQIGLESGSDKVLRLMRKTFTAETSEQNIRFAKEAGIETEVFVITGFPGEAEKDFKKTYDFIKRNSRHIDTIKSINTLHLIAGTEIYEERGKFAIKPLPRENWHYLWETYGGNTYKVREKRSRKLLDLAGGLGIKVMEANIQEGKENALKAQNPGSLSALKESINSLQSLPLKRKRKAGGVKVKRKTFKWLMLAFAAVYAFFYIVYFWGYMVVRDKALLGGKRR